MTTKAAEHWHQATWTVPEVPSDHLTSILRRPRLTPGQVSTLPEAPESDLWQRDGAEGYTIHAPGCEPIAACVVWRCTDSHSVPLVPVRGQR